MVVVPCYHSEFCKYLVPMKCKIYYNTYNAPVQEASLDYFPTLVQRKVHKQLL